MSQQVTIVSETSSKSILESVRQREEEIAGVRKELVALESTLDEITTKICAKRAP